jgi:hypothetical protein
MKILVLVAVIALVANVTFAGLLVDLRATGSLATADGKTISLDPSAAAGTAVNIEVWAQITGGDATNRLKSLQGWMVETASATPAAKGDMSVTGDKYAIYGDIFGTGAVLPQIGRGTANTLNPWGDREINVTNYPFNPRNSAEYTTVGNEWFYVGHFTYTTNTAAVAGGIDTLINFNPKSTSATGADYYVGTTKCTGTTAGYASNGAITVKCVPEPSTIVLLGLGALALVFVRRRK